jgi:hypothetical protein
MLAREIMTPGCATCDADLLLSDAVSLMTARRMHRLVVTENDQPVGVISMTDVVRKIIGEIRARSDPSRRFSPCVQPGVWPKALLILRDREGLFSSTWRISCHASHRLP